MPSGGSAPRGRTAGDTCAPWGGTRGADAGRGLGAAGGNRASPRARMLTVPRSLSDDPALALRVSGLPAQGLLCLPPRPAHRARENRQLPDQDSEEQRGSRARLRRGGSQAGRCGSPELEPRPQPRPQPGAPPAPLTRAGVGRGWRTAAPSRPPQTPAPCPGPSAPHGTPCRHLTVRSGAQSAGVVSLRQRAPLQPWWMPTRENKIKSSGSY